MDYFTLRKEQQNRKDISHEKVDHLVARICLEIDRLAHRLLRLKGSMPEDMRPYLLKYTLEKRVKEEEKPEPKKSDVVTQTIHQKAMMFAALGITQKAKWEGPLPNGE